MRRTFPSLVAAAVLLLPATAHAGAPQCTSHVGAADELVTSPGEPVTASSLCTDPDGDTFTLTPSSPAGGTATAGSNALTYAPRAGFHGQDSFTYTAQDAHGDTSAPASVAVLVDTAPVCLSGTARIAAGASLVADPPCDDADDDDFTISFSDPQHGRLDFPDDGSAPTYVPAPGFSGIDTIPYYAFDSFGLASDDATLTITVTAPPVVQPSPPPPPPRDTTPPSAALAATAGQKLKQVLAGGLRLMLSSNEAGRATVVATLDAATARRLHLKREVARASVTAVAGKLSVTLRLGAKARKALKRLKKVRLSIAAVISDAAGNSARRTLTVTLRR